MTRKFAKFDTFPEHQDTVRVRWDDYKFGNNSVIIGTVGMGPCLGITLYHPKTGIGALAHISNRKHLVDSEEVLANNIVDTLLNEFFRYGVKDPRHLEATLVGESHHELKDLPSEIVRSELYKKNIPIIGEDLGNVPNGRMLYLYCNTGNVGVYRP